MNASKESRLLRIFIGEDDRVTNAPLYEWLVRQARARGLAGATVLRGIMGFGAHSKITHALTDDRLSEDLPIIIEIIDSEDKIDDFLAFAERSMQRGMLATVERVQIRVYRIGTVES